MTRPRRNARFLGLLLTWLAGVAAVLVTLPVAGVAVFSLWLAHNGVQEPGSGFACLDRDCVDEWAAVGLIAGSITVAVILLLVLAVWSTRRSLIAALVLSMAVVVVLAVCICAVLMGMLAWVPTWLLGWPLSIAAVLALGSVLRLWTRRSMTRVRRAE